MKVQPVANSSLRSQCSSTSAPSRFSNMPISLFACSIQSASCGHCPDSCDAHSRCRSASPFSPFTRCPTSLMCIAANGGGDQPEKCGALYFLFPATDRRPDPALEFHRAAIAATHGQPGCFCRRRSPFRGRFGQESPYCQHARRARRPDFLTSGQADSPHPVPGLDWLLHAADLFDFSGYSDMAIGMGKMFGFTFMENFNFPYTAQSIRDFWRRWHISLSTWFRDYLYIPLGGNRFPRPGPI